MTISPQPVKCRIVVDNKPVEPTMEIKHLSLLLTSCAGFKEIREQVMKAITNRRMHESHDFE